VLSVELVPLHQKIVDLRKQLSIMSAEPKPNKTEFRAILEELRKIDQYVRHGRERSFELTSRKRVDGKFLGPGGSSVPEGQELLSGLLDSAFEMSQDIKGRGAQDDVSPSIKPIYDRLSEMKAQLDQLCELIVLRLHRF
jgi:hypothetical protein